MTLLGQKARMTQLYDEKGGVMPATPIDVGGCVVVARRTRSEHGYEALQLGFGAPGKRGLTKAVEGHFKKAGAEPRGWLHEVRVADSGQFQVGQQLGADQFQPGDKVAVTGWTRGRGFSGGMRRWGWHGGPASHGSMSHRRIGSVSSGSSPGRVWPGRSLPGHYGTERVTVRNLKVVRVDAEKGLVYVGGAVPGHSGGRVLLRKGS
jgi:large subunit ribosomal protein L3